jgi:hypothetical protein
LTIPGKPESPGPFVAAYSPDCPGVTVSTGYEIVVCSSSDERMDFPAGRQRAGFARGGKFLPSYTASGQ